MELVAIFIIIFLVYAGGWIWQTVTDILRDINRENWESRVYGQVASSRSVKRRLGGRDFAALRKVFADLAEKRDGQVHDRALFESPKVSFLHKTGRVLLSIYETRHSKPRFFTQVTITIPEGWSHRLEVSPEEEPDPDVRYRNLGDLQVGDQEFDRRYLIRSGEPEFPRKFLDEAMRADVDRLRVLGGTDHVLVSVNSSRLMVRKSSILSSLPDLEQFLDLGCRIYDRVFLMWTRESGIEIMEEDQVEQGPAVCQVCGVELDKEKSVFCRRCRTPHHQDCWEYNNGCSTFACGETKYVSKY